MASRGDPCPCPGDDAGRLVAMARATPAARTLAPGLALVTTTRPGASRPASSGTGVARSLVTSWRRASRLAGPPRGPRAKSAASRPRSRAGTSGGHGHAARGLLPGESSLAEPSDAGARELAPGADGASVARAAQRESGAGGSGATRALVTLARSPVGGGGRLVPGAWRRGETSRASWQGRPAGKERDTSRERRCGPPGKETEGTSGVAACPTCRAWLLRLALPSCPSNYSMITCLVASAT